MWCDASNGEDGVGVDLPTELWLLERGLCEEVLGLGVSVWWSAGEG